VDIGLLSAQAGLEASAFTDPNHEIFSHFKGALTEQFVLQELKCANPRMPLYYWANDRGIAEIDFVAQAQNLVIPIEAKASINAKSRSLKSYQEKYAPPVSVRTSLLDYAKREKLVDIPLYLIGAFEKLVLVSEER
jgi:predicted AAA+ superfamily ATPase